STLMSEKFVWSGGGKLCVHTLFDETDEPQLSRKYDYDKHGNVTSETLYGRFTHNAGKIHIDKNGFPKADKCDELTTKYAYSDDGFNLKTKEWDPLGNLIEYKYVKDTNLLKAKFTYAGKQIKKREFLSYDDNAVLKERIVDDGSSEDKNDLKGVT